MRLILVVPSLHEWSSEAFPGRLHTVASCLVSCWTCIYVYALDRSGFFCVCAGVWTQGLLTYSASILTFTEPSLQLVFLYLFAFLISILRQDLTITYSPRLVSKWSLHALLPKCWGYRHVPTCSARTLILKYYNCIDVFSKHKLLVYILENGLTEVERM